jgi:hypothetical protein
MITLTLIPPKTSLLAAAALAIASAFAVLAGLQAIEAQA